MAAHGGEASASQFLLHPRTGRAEADATQDRAAHAKFSFAQAQQVDPGHNDIAAEACGADCAPSHQGRDDRQMLPLDQADGAFARTVAAVARQTVQVIAAVRAATIASRRAGRTPSQRTSPGPAKVSIRRAR